MTLVLPARFRRSIVSHARGKDPEECCGILVGRHEEEGAVAVVEAVVETANAARQRRRRYQIPPADLAAAQHRAREEGRAVVGYYHSHPADPATPSRSDLETAWPGARYLIVSLAGLGRPVLRAFKLRDDGDGFEEEPCRDGRSSRRFLGEP